MLVPIGEVATELEVARATAARLMVCGLCGPVTMRARRVVDAELVTRLARRPLVLDPLPLAFVVRVGEPTHVDEGWRSQIGWDEAWPDAVKRDAVRGDWVHRAGPVMAAGRLVAVVGPVVVGAWEVIEVEEGESGSGRRRSRFQIRSSTAAARPYVGRLWRLPAGWTAAVI